MKWQAIGYRPRYTDSPTSGAHLRKAYIAIDYG